MWSSKKAGVYNFQTNWERAGGTNFQTNWKRAGGKRAGVYDFPQKTKNGKGQEGEEGRRQIVPSVLPTALLLVDVRCCTVNFQTKNL